MIASCAFSVYLFRFITAISCQPSAARQAQPELETGELEAGR
jgi:hypothetical protein